MRTIVMGALVGVILGAMSGTASADPFTDARQNFTRAQELYKAGKYQQAADKYETSYRIIRAPLIFFNIAQARRLQFQSGGNHTHLLAAIRYYEQFLKEADPKPAQKTRAESNLKEARVAGTEEAKKQFQAAQLAYQKGKDYIAAIAGFDAAYDLSRRPAVLFNLAQAERKQFHRDQKLLRLARAEQLILNYQRESESIPEETINQILAEIRQERAHYQRKREAEARKAEPGALGDARNSYARGDAPAALGAIAKAESTKGNPRVVLLQLYRLRGQAAVMANQEGVAVEAFKRYLALEPAADGTGLAKEAMVAFGKAKTYWKTRNPLKLDHIAPGQVPPRKPVDISVKVASDPLKMVDTRELKYRRHGFKKWETIPLLPAVDIATIPRTPLPLVGKSYEMEYYIVARDRNDAELESLGRPSAPLQFLVTKDAIPKPIPLYKKWWVWAGTGAAVAGGVAAFFILTDNTPPIIADF